MLEILSGIAMHYTPEELVGKTVAAIVNLPPRKMMGLESCGMLLSAVRMVNGKEEPIDVSKVDVSMNGIELQDREFIAAIREGREPNSSVGKVFDCYRVLGELEKQLEAAR